MAQRGAALAFAAVAAACGGGGGGDASGAAPAAGGALAEGRAALRGGCDESLQQAFAGDPATRLLLVRPFARGEPLVLDSAGSPAAAPRAAAELCLVKLLVGPGNPGPADAPSTSPGIGIEVWLPAPEHWNGRIHAKGGGGWAGGPNASPLALGVPTSAAGDSPAETAGIEGAVSASTDAGHAIEANGSFALNPDGSINTVLWRDFAARGVHELAVKTKALTRAYYGRDARHAYWNGFSTGGRQGLMAAQAHPADFDGILAGAPAIHWSRFVLGHLYPQLVIARELGGTAPTQAQHGLVAAAATAACDVVGGQHLGYVPDPALCRYDPTRDPGVLCPPAGGHNAGPHCLSLAQAHAFNKFWYGATADGSVPDPAADNGYAPALAAGQQWYGIARGADLGSIAGAKAFPIATDMLALTLQDARLASPGFVNAGGRGADGWRSFDFPQLAAAAARAQALQPQFGHVDADSVDLSALRRRGGRILLVHGLADALIPPQGSIHYYHRAAGHAGGFAATQEFFRLYLVPGMAHGFASGAVAPGATPPLPTNAQLYQLLTEWVEQGRAPGRIEVASTAPVPRSRPLCPYPQQARYRTGDAHQSVSYDCA